MKVAEFIKVLEQFDPDDDLLMSTDSEGNSYHHADDVLSKYNYDPSEGYLIESLYLRELTDELRKQGYDEEDLGDEDWDLKPCVVMYP